MAARCRRPLLVSVALAVTFVLGTVGQWVLAAAAATILVLGMRRPSRRRLSTDKREDQ